MEALRRLQHHLERKAFVASFDRPKMTSKSLLASATGLSPYLRFGCVSTRYFYHKLMDLYKKVLITKFFSNFRNILTRFVFFSQRLKRRSRRCRCTDNYSGVNFFTAPPRIIPISIAWEVIRFAYKFPGTKIQMLSPNGLTWVKLYLFSKLKKSAHSIKIITVLKQLKNFRLLWNSDSYVPFFE